MEAAGGGGVDKATDRRGGGGGGGFCMCNCPRVMVCHANIHQPAEVDTSRVDRADTASRVDRVDMASRADRAATEEDTKFRHLNGI